MYTLADLLEKKWVKFLLHAASFLLLVILTLVFMLVFPEGTAEHELFFSLLFLLAAALFLGLYALVLDYLSEVDNPAVVLLKWAGFAVATLGLLAVSALNTVSLSAALSPEAEVSLAGVSPFLLALSAMPVSFFALSLVFYVLGIDGWPEALSGFFPPMAFAGAYLVHLIFALLGGTASPFLAVWLPMILAGFCIFIFLFAFFTGAYPFGFGLDFEREKKPKKAKQTKKKTASRAPAKAPVKPAPKKKETYTFTSDMEDIVLTEDGPAYVSDKKARSPKKKTEEAYTFTSDMEDIILIEDGPEYGEPVYEKSSRPTPRKSTAPAESEKAQDPGFRELITLLGLGGRIDTSYRGRRFVIAYSARVSTNGHEYLSTLSPVIIPGSAAEGEALRQDLSGLASHVSKTVQERVLGFIQGYYNAFFVPGDVNVRLAVDSITFE